MKGRSNESSGWWIALVLIVLAVSPYWQTRSHDFLNYDDSYVTENSVILNGVSWNAIKWSFTSLEGGHWQPLTWLSHMLACDMFRSSDGAQWPGGHHLFNVALHALNTLLMWGVLRRLTGAMWRSALVAALFAVHPLHVESVAWITERRDMLSTMFGLAAIWCYTLYAQGGGWKAYLATLICFVLSLMSKTMLVTLPALLLLLDYWPLRRMPWKPLSTKSEPITTVRSPGWLRLLAEKIPMALISIAFSAVAVVASVKSLPSLDDMSLGARLSNVTVAYAMYLWRMIVPLDLAVFYPLQTWERWQVAAAAGTLGAISLLAIALHRRAPWLLVGWLWYLGLLVPVIGLVQVGLQSMADRYSYLSAVGVFIMLVWSMPGRDAQRAVFPWVAVACAIVAALLVVAHAQTSHWRDSRTLFTHAIRVTTDNYIAHQNLGNALEKEGRLDLAMEQYQRSVAIRPGYGKIHENIANVLIQRGRMADAINQIERAISLDPESQTAYNSKGVILLASGQPAAAEEALARSVQLDPGNFEAHGNYGLALLQNRKFAQAIEELTLVKLALPQRLGVRTNLAMALAGHGRADLAMAELEEILRAKPDFAPAQAVMRQIQGATTSPPASQPGG